MSFRTRLTGFFVLIVVVPMIAFGFLVFRLIGDSQHGKADARADGLASAASSLYNASAADARADAQTVARALQGVPQSAMKLRLVTLDNGSGLARLTVVAGAHKVVSLGSTAAVAPGTVVVRSSKGVTALRVTASELTGAQYAEELAGPGVGVIVTQGGRTLGSTLPSAAHVTPPAGGDVTIAGVGYQAVTRTFAGFGSPVRVTVLSNLSAPGDSVGSSRLVAAIFIAGFLLLAFAFSVLASRALQGQIARFLSAARRLAGGDFSSRVPIQGRDEFAALGDEFNSMSEQLAVKIEELEQERGRLRQSLRRIGQTFASNLDRKALLELALQTAIDGAEASCGRLTLRSNPSEQLREFGVSGSLAGFEATVSDAEREALHSRGIGEARTGDRFVASVALGLIDGSDRAHGQITVGKERPFTDDDRDMLRSLAAQTTLALENVDLHHQVQRQAVTDELTGLANHGRFQELLTAELDQVRRYEHPVGLIMLDIDNFKSVNDTYGHPQGDVVLKHVARVLRENSRDADSPARYGGEEMALILPHTDLPGAHAIAERVRSAIEGLHIPRLDQDGVLRVTASVGVAASTEGDKEALVAEADGALYTAKRGGKNRTVAAQAANVGGGE
jgi:diguanylate cyclase (GGDEF)-like protein